MDNEMAIRSAIDHTKPGFSEVSKLHHNWRSTEDIRKFLENAFPGIEFPFIEEDHLYGVRSDVHTYCTKHKRISRMSLSGMLYGGTKYGCDACAFENGSYRRKLAFKARPIGASFLESGIFFALKKEFPDTTKGMMPDGKEVDIWVPSVQMGIEFDGNYWHTESKGRGVNYHLGKSALAGKCSVGLTHLWTEEAVAPFTNIVNIAKMERDKPQLGDSRRANVCEVDFDEVEEFYRNWSTRHLFFAKDCDMHVALKYRGTIRAAVSIRTDKRLVTFVASSFYTFNLREFMVLIAKENCWPQVGWLQDLRSGSDTMRTHDFHESDIVKLIDPKPWHLDSNAGIAKFHGTAAVSDVVWDCGYTLFRVNT